MAVQPWRKWFGRKEEAQTPSTIFVRSMLLTEAESEPFKIRLANRPETSIEACALVNERYIPRGYGAQKMSAGEGCLTLVAYEHRLPVGTLTVRFDRGEGLLSDQLYPQELAALRASGRRLCEFTKLATKSSLSSMATLAALFHVAFIHAGRLNGCTDVVIEVNPRHVPFYTKQLGFVEVGPQRLNERVQAPAVLLACSFDHIASQLETVDPSEGAAARRRSFYANGLSARQALAVERMLMQLPVPCAADDGAGCNSNVQ